VTVPTGVGGGGVGGSNPPGHYGGGQVGLFGNFSITILLKILAFRDPPLFMEWKNIDY